MKRFRNIPAWCWLAGIALLLRLGAIGAESLWYDEAFTAMIARAAPDRLWAAILGDVHPPLWYALEWLIVQLIGPSEIALRLPSAVFGFLAVMLVYLLALAVGFPRRTAFLAGLLAAIMPGALYYSQDARMYPLLACGVLLATWAAARQRWAWFAVGCIIAVYAQNIAAFYVGALSLAVVVVYWRNQAVLQRAGRAWLFIAAAWAPWALLGLPHQASMVGAGWWLPPLTPGGVFFPLANLTFSWRSDGIFHPHLTAAAMALTLVGLVVSRRWLRGPSLLVAVLAFGVPALLALFSVLWRNVFLHRALLPSAMALPIFWSYGLLHLGKPNRRIAWLVAIPALAVGLLGHYFPANGRDDLRAWFSAVRDQWQASDVVYHLTTDSVVLGVYYLEGLPYAALPESNDLSQSLTDETKDALGWRRVAFDQLPALGYRRAWLMVNFSPMISKVELAEFSRIALTYSPILIRWHGNKIANTAIYLVVFDGYLVF